MGPLRGDRHPSLAILGALIGVGEAVAAGRQKESPPVLRDASYRNLLIGRTVSLIGDGIAPVAIAIAVLDLTGSAADLGIVLGVRSVLLVGLLLAGGVVADRVSPRRSMIQSDLVRFVAMGLIAVLLISGQAEIWELAVLYGVHGVATALFNPASAALPPLILNNWQLQPGNAMLGLAKAGGQVVGPAIAGVLLALASAGWAFAVDSATFLISAAFLWRVAARPYQREAVASFVAELREGWTEFSSRTWVWAGVTAASVVNALFFPAFQVLGPLVAKGELGGAGAWAVIAAAFGAGGFVGGVVSIRLRPRFPLLVSETVILLLSTPLFLLGPPAGAAVIATGALIAGAGLTAADTYWDTTFQQHIPQTAMARVSAYDWFGSMVLQPIGFAIVGPLAVALGTDGTLVAAAALMTAIQLSLLAVPSVRRLEAQYD